MRKKALKTKLTERDLKVLRLLFENRVATNWDINQKFFNDQERRDVGKRLKRLRDINLIGMDTDLSLDRMYFYYLLPSGLKKCFPGGRGLDGLRLRSPYVAHDYMLSRVRNVLEQSRLIHDYYTENMLALDSYQSEIGHIFKFYDQFHPDVIFSMVGKKGKIYNALEVELHQKGQEDYRRNIQQYYFNEKISYVFFVSSSRAIENKVMAEEKRLYPRGNTKFYYGGLKTLLSKKLPFAVKNCRGKKFDLE